MNAPTAPSAIQALCERGVEHHMAGRLRDAAMCYEQVLRHEPGHFDALHLLGIICVDVGQPERGVALLQRAVTADPSVGPAHSNLGKALNDLGRHPAALDHCDQAVALQPDFPEAHNNRGLALLGLDRAEAALAAFEQAVGLNPDFAEAHNNLALTLSRLDRPTEALARFDRALGLRPRYAQAEANRANLLRRLDLHAQALAGYDRAVALQPSLASAHNNRGLTLHALERYDEALASFDRAIALEPGSAEAYNNRALTLQALHRSREALADYDRAITLDARFAGLHSNRAYPLLSLDRFEEALSSCEAEIALRPDMPEPYLAGGFALDLLKRPDEAMAWLDRAITLRPNYADAHMNRGMSLLRLGRYEVGWADYEWRAIKPNERSYDPARLWRGDADLAGKRLFVHHEQGFGDTLQFCRFAKVLIERGVDLVLSVHRGLEELVAQIAPPGRVIGPDEPAPDFDYHCRLLSLPFALGTTLETLPVWPCYLKAEAARRAKFEAMLGPRTRPRIGLAWSGNPAHVNDQNRSIAFAQLTPLLSADAQWVCLQKELRASDAEALAADGRVVFLGERLGDFSDTAGLIELLDLVITVDTSVAHLAGALGKPVWILLPNKADWRWLWDRDDSPWYPSARLFRQPEPSDWAGVITRVQAELAV